LNPLDKKLPQFFAGARDSLVRRILKLLLLL